MSISWYISKISIGRVGRERTGVRETNEENVMLIEVGGGGQGVVCPSLKKVLSLSLFIIGGTWE
jgi:hypothetical protein